MDHPQTSGLGGHFEINILGSAMSRQNPKSIVLLGAQIVMTIHQCNVHHSYMLCNIWHFFIRKKETDSNIVKIIHTQTFEHPWGRCSRWVLFSISYFNALADCFYNKHTSHMYIFSCLLLYCRRTKGAIFTGRTKQTTAWKLQVVTKVSLAAGGSATAMSKTVSVSSSIQ